MHTTPPARLRIPLFAALMCFLLCWAIALPARSDEGTGPAITVLEMPYPFWFSPFIGGNQDSFKFGDKTTISVEITDDSPITNVTGELSEVGVPDPLPIPLLLTRDAQHHLYRAETTINSHADGLASIQVTATDELGRVTTKSIEVHIDNTAPTFSIDSLSFVHVTTTPVLDDPMLVSGSIDPAASKAFVTDMYYTLYGKDGAPFFTLGSFRPQGMGVALSTLGPGAFTDTQIQLWLDRNAEFPVPDAAFLSLTATVIDGAGNSTIATSPRIAIPRADTSDALSNVLFLPGIEGSRHYEPAPRGDPSFNDCIERRLWDPSSDSDLSGLFLDADGSSLNRVYTKEGDIIDGFGPFKFYRSFFEDLNDMKNAGTVNDWQAVAYDWRLSPETLARTGAQYGSHIDYARASSTPYIEQTLRTLAASSKTGKVTIIAHSAGGLVAKALLQKLGDAETARLVDNVVFVGVPQSGTPQALAGLLHGYGNTLNTSRAQVRLLGSNAAMMYDLLPSAQYFADVFDPLHPVVSFIADHLFANERAAYGSSITTENEQITFAANVDAGHTKPSADDLSVPNILNANLLGAANESHDALDAWVPPPSVNVFEIAGWGADTLSGIQYYEAEKASAPGGYVARYRPQFVEDGDATVLIPSALMLPLAQNVKRYWVNLTQNIPLQPLGGASHANLFELNDVRSFIRNVLTGIDTLPGSITATQPDTLTQRKKLLFVLHGIANATLTDDAGNKTSIGEAGNILLGLPGVQAGIFGDTGYFLASVGTAYKLILEGSSTVDVDVQNLIDDVVADTTTFEDVPADAHTEVDVTPDGTATVPQPSSITAPVVRNGSTRAITVSRTKGIANSRSVLTPPKPIPVPKVAGAATTTKKKAATPKAKPLTKKAKTALSALLDQLTAELQGLLTKLPH